MEASLDAPRESVRRGFFFCAPGHLGGEGQKIRSNAKNAGNTGFCRRQNVTICMNCYTV